MKILFCARHLLGNGGQEGYLKRLAAYLARRGHAVEVLTTAADPIAGVTVTRIDAPARGGRSRREWQACAAIAAALARRAGEVSFGGQKLWGCSVLRPGGGVEAAYWREYLNDRYRWAPARRLAAWSSGKRRHDLDAESRGYRDPALRAVIVNSELVREGLRRHYPGVAARARVICNGADTTRFQPPRDSGLRAAVHDGLGLRPDRLTAVFSGHNFRLKGLPQAIAAVAAATRRGGCCQLIVLGGGRPGPMRRQARRLGVGDSVRFVGNTAEPERYYAASDVLLFPSFYDPCANVTFEALACGLPVISTRRNGASEVLCDARDGWVVEHPDHIAALAEHLAMLRDPARLADMKSAARATALRHPIEAKFAEIEATLADIAG